MICLLNDLLHYGSNGSRDLGEIERNIEYMKTS